MSSEVFPGATEEQLEFPTLSDSAFDEMNLVELPFSLLSIKADGRRSLPLSPNGNERLVADEAVEGLPTALAERVILGLMWLTKRETNFTSPVIRFALRDLVTDYVYPGRFNSSYRPNTATLQSVEEQIRRVAHTRLISERWFDRVHARHVSIDAAIIDYLLVVEPGGRTASRTLEIRWGAKFFESVRAHYTKPIDLETYQRIEAPLDRRLYRWLDRQLSVKSVQVLKSCQAFARFKLAMTGEVIERGGRTASSYIVKALSESLERLSELGFKVSLTVDPSHPDHALTFARLPDGAPSNEVHIDDPGVDLVRAFEEAAHGIPRDRSKTPISPSEHAMARRWITTYGRAQALWMISRCVELQREGNAPRILKFAGLERYEAAAAGDYAKFLEVKSGQMILKFREGLRGLWDRYRRTLTALDVTPAEVEALQREASAQVDANPLARTFSPATRAKLEQSHFLELKLAHLGVMPEDVFLAYENLDELRKALVQRHGFDPLHAEVS